jgi:gamma-glutamylcyclotransferase (GGCT)/AIG2-like uncharacterized protein YtfP
MASPRARSKTDPDYLFVYGTLRASAGHQMNAVLEQYGDLVGSGKVPGILYDVGRYPGAVKSSGTRAFVRGDLYALRNPDRALKVLDRYEGWDEKKPRSGEFKRSRVLVSLGGGRTVKAWIYLYNRPTTGLTRIRSGDYLAGSPRTSRALDKRAR